MALLDLSNLEEYDVIEIFRKLAVDSDNIIDAEVMEGLAHTELSLFVNFAVEVFSNRDALLEVNWDVNNSIFQFTIVPN